tara:strand:- start:316 stop:492 length:177 start_codon:yes stop_codon:yes gene_type:complete
MTTTIYTVKAIINGQCENLWSGYNKQEARRVSANYDTAIPFGGDISWIWDNNKELIVR